MKPEFTVNGLEFSEILPEKYCWYHAIKLNADGWRLPEKLELLMLYEQEPNSHQDEWFWATSPDAYCSNFAWLVNLYYGTVGYYYKTYIYAVRLVRETTK